MIVSPAWNNGAACPSSPVDENCTALIPTCDIIDCVMAEWSNWTDCSATCGEDVVKTRTRDIEIQPLFGGLECEHTEEILSCNLDKCVSNRFVEDV